MNIFRAMSYYTGTAVINNAVPFLLIPVLTRVLVPTDYGIMSTLVAYAALIAPAVLLGIPTLISIEFFKLPRAELISRGVAWILLPVVAAAALTIVLFVFRRPVSRLSQLPVDWVPLLPGIALLGLLPQSLSVFFRVSDQPRRFALFELLQGLLQALLTLGLVWGLLLGWRGRMYAIVMAGATASVVAAVVLRRQLFPGRPRIAGIRDTLGFGMALMPHSVLSQVIRMADRLLIAAFFSMTYAGQYAVAVQVSSIMLVMLSTFNQAWTPYLFESLGSIDEHTKSRLVRLSYKIAGGMIALAIAVNIVAYVLYHTVIYSSYSESKKFVPWLTAGYCFLGFYLLFTDYIFFTKRMSLLSAITTFNAVVSIGSSLIFMHIYGVMGVSYGFTFANLVTAMIAWVLCNKVYPMPWLKWRPS